MVGTGTRASTVSGCVTSAGHTADSISFPGGWEELALLEKLVSEVCECLACYSCTQPFSLSQLLSRLAAAMIGVWFDPSDTQVEL